MHEKLTEILFLSRTIRCLFYLMISANLIKKFKTETKKNKTLDKTYLKIDAAKLMAKSSVTRSNI